MRNVDKMVTKFKTLIYVILLLSFYSLFHWARRRVGVQITILTAKCTFIKYFLFHLLKAGCWGLIRPPTCFLADYVSMTTIVSDWEEYRVF